MKQKLLSFGLAFLIAVSSVAGLSYAEEPVQAVELSETQSTNGEQNSQSEVNSAESGEEQGAVSPEAAGEASSDEQNLPSSDNLQNSEQNSTEQSTEQNSTEQPTEQSSEQDSSLVTEETMENMRGALPTEVTNRAPARLNNAVSDIRFVNRLGNDTETVFSQGQAAQIYFSVDIDLTGQDVQAGDFVQLKFPEGIVLFDRTIEAIPDSNDSGIFLADFVMEKATGTATLTFRDGVQNRDNITGSIQFEALLVKTGSTIFGEHEYDILTGEQTSIPVKFRVIPSVSKYSMVYEEKLYKNGYADNNEQTMNYHIRINRMKTELNDVRITDVLTSKDTRLVQYIPESFALYKVTYGDKEYGDGYGVAWKNNPYEQITLDDSNLTFSKNYTTFELLLPNVGTDSYYLEYKTTHFNDKASIKNEAFIDNRPDGQADYQWVQPYDRVETIKAVDGTVLGVGPFNTRLYKGHVRIRDAWKGTSAQVSSGKKDNLTIQKLDEDNNLLAGAVFQVYKVYTDSEKTLLSDKTYVTNEQGYVVVSEVEEGKSYVVVETKAPNGYLLDETPYKTPTIKENGSVVSVVNKKDPAGNTTPVTPPTDNTTPVNPPADNSGGSSTPVAPPNNTTNNATNTSGTTPNNSDSTVQEEQIINESSPLTTVDQATADAVAAILSAERNTKVAGESRQITKIASSQVPKTGVGAVSYGFETLTVLSLAVVGFISKNKEK